MIKRIEHVALLLIGIFSLGIAASDTKPQWPSGSWLDLSHDFSEDTIYWPTAEHFTLIETYKGFTERGYYYASNDYRAAEHGGTHIDAPIHFAEGKRTVDTIPLEQLIGAAVVIDVSAKTLKDPDYQVDKVDFTAWEEQNGQIPNQAIVLLYTGFSRYWPDAEKYLGTAERGQAAVAKLHFPGLHPQAAQWLVKERNIKAIGLDTASIDYGQSKMFESHQILFKANIPVFENLANLDKIPSTDLFLIALPMKIKNGSGAPLRIIALLPD